ncbi:MAG TPA: SRPBCC family protein [Candidatus Binatia bacterium]|nr:SRPBCC family protein [Candidatus Binatia bacterium]
MGVCPVAWAKTWGATAAERRLAFPCDRHLADPDDAWFRAVDVDAPPAVVFRWLCQLRAAPYSYDWIDNWGRRSPPVLVPGLERLAVGDRVMTIFELVDFEPDRSLTIVLRHGRAAFGELAVTYAALPRGPAGTRLVVKLLLRATGPPRWIFGTLGPWLDLVMMRRQLLNLKRLAEATARRL